MTGEFLRIANEIVSYPKVAGLLISIIAVSNVYSTLYNHHSFRTKAVSTIKLIVLVVGVEYMRYEAAVLEIPLAATIFVGLLASSLSFGDWLAYVLCKYTDLSSRSTWEFIINVLSNIEKFCGKVRNKAQRNINPPKTNIVPTGYISTQGLPEMEAYIEKAKSRGR